MRIAPLCMWGLLALATLGSAAAESAAPTISGTPRRFISAGEFYEFKPIASDADGNPLTFSVRGLPPWLKLNSGTGVISGTPTNDVAGDSSDILLSVSDGQSSAALPLFFTSVMAVLPALEPAPANNKAPLISGTPMLTVAPSQAYSFTPSASDPESRPLTYLVWNKPTWANFSTTTGRLSGTPDASQAGTYSNILISARDGYLTTPLTSFTVTVTATSSGSGGTGTSGGTITTNHPPIIAGTPATTVRVGSAYSFWPAMWDQESDPLTFSISGKPAWATFNTISGSLVGTPTSAHVGTYSNIVITTTDGKASVSLPAFSITVTAGTTNRPPTISGSPATSVTVGSAYSFTPTASDPDGNPLGFSITGKPAWATFSIANGRLSGTPTSAQVGTYSSIVISANDGTATVALPAFTLSVVAGANGAPTISGSPKTTVQAGSAYAFTPTASDPEGNALTFSISGRPAWSAFNASTGALSGTPNSTQMGTYSSIVISVSDGTSSRSLPAFSINVTSPGTGTGTATLGWTAPTQNTDGTTLTTLAGFKLYHGTSAASLTDVRTISSPGVTTFVFDQLPTGTHYFAVSAVNSSGTESARSAVGSKTIP
jgi:Putative Ig domain